MRRKFFRYNPKTCRYEPAPFPWARYFSVILLFAGSTWLFFHLFSQLQPVFFPTAKLTGLLRENQAYRQSIASMKQSLTEMDQLLTGLQQREEELVRKIYGSPYLPAVSVGFMRTHPEQETTRLIAQLCTAVDRLRQATEKGIAVYAPRTAAHPSWPVLWPVDADNPSVASGFGQRIHPFHKARYFHTGLDIPAVKGQAVRAAGSGRVTKVVRTALESGYGNYVDIGHGGGVISRYACLADITVRTGQQVVDGMVIGYAGMSGNAVAPHLHFEIMVNGQPVNPLLFLVKNHTTRTYARLWQEGNIVNQALD